MARILVVDDENNIRMMIRLALTHSGHTVETAADGDEGLTKYGDGTNWDLVVLDQRMPGMEGLAVLKQIRYHNPNARVVMATAFGTVDLAVDAMKAGATDLIRKPFTTETLRAAVQSALGSEARAGTQTDAGTPAAPPSGITFGMTTINGYRIEFQTGTSTKANDGLGFPFIVRHPDGEAKQCTVTLSPVVVELIKAHLDRETVPGGERFYQALCEESLANYLYQNADFPPDNRLPITELTSGMKRFMDAIVSAS